MNDSHDEKGLFAAGSGGGGQKASNYKQHIAAANSHNAEALAAGSKGDTKGEMANDKASEAHRTAATAHLTNRPDAAAYSKAANTASEQAARSTGSESKLGLAAKASNKAEESGLSRDHRAAASAHFEAMREAGQKGDVRGVKMHTDAQENHARIAKAQTSAAARRSASRGKGDLGY